jgi:poly-gamma-glutamate synthesis protein (capsule biosynthesis protein)
MSFDTKGFLFVAKVSLGVFVLFFVAHAVSSYVGEILFPNSLEVQPLFLSHEQNQQNVRFIPPYITPYKTVESKFGSAPSSSQGRYIAADLEKMEMVLYASGTPLATVPILSKGRRGTPWETPTGVYEVKTKEEKHFSSTGHVWMPYSLQIYGNYFIHGWPYESDGTPVPPGYSGGCIRLSTEDAKKVYNFVSIGTPVYVKEHDYNADAQAFIEHIKIYPASLPQINAESYLIVDMKTGAVLLEKNAATARPIASLTKLMTAVVGSEVVFLDRTAVVAGGELETLGKTGSLVAGERLSLQKLLYPLLLESSNDAAEAIASMVYRRSAFITMMNEKASALGMISTRFADPAGISENNISTTEDLFRLTKYIYDKRSFLFGITRLERYGAVGSKNGGDIRHDWKNNNHFFSDPAFVGGKTGHTTAAQDTMISIFNVPSQDHEHTVGIIVLGSQNRESDTRALLSWARTALRPPQETPIRMGFVGDVMMNRGVEQKIRAEGGADFRFPFLRISEALQKYDILFGNLEGPISDQGEKVGSIYSFRMDLRAMDGLTFAGFDVMSVANNHMGDWTKRAMKDTFVRLKDAGIIAVGGGMTENEAYAPQFINKSGTRIGFVAFSEFGKGYLEGDDNVPGIAIIEKSRVIKSVKDARNKADIVVMSFHFGAEYQDTPTAFQKEIARAAIDAGADLVVGHHPHVLQPLEKYHGGYIKYSLGNFVFDQYFSESTMTSEILEVDVDQRKITDVREVPVSINTSYQPELK